MNNDYFKWATRYVIGYNKIPDEDGDCLAEVKYKLKPIKTSLLQKAFNVSPSELDPWNRNVEGCREIHEFQAEFLRRYLIEGEIDLNKYDYMLHTYAES